MAEDERISMSPETEVRVRAIVQQVYAAGAMRGGIPDSEVDIAVEELAVIFRDAFAGGVIWMATVADETVKHATDHMLEGIPDEVLQRLRDIQERPTDG